MGTVGYFYSNVAVPAKVGNSGGLSNSATSLYALSTPLGYPQQFPFKLRLDPDSALEEVVKVTAGAGTPVLPWTIVRGWDGTTQQAHAQQADLAHGISQEDLALSRQHEASDSASSVLPHGLPGAAWLTAAFAVINEKVLADSTTSTLTWPGIPQTYSHLLVVAQARSTDTGSQESDVTCVINGDTTARYSFLSITANTLTGALVGPNAFSSFATTNWNALINIAASQAGSAANAGGGFAFFPNYAGTSSNKMFVGLSGMGNGTSSALTGKVRWGYYNPVTQAGISSLTLAASAGTFRTGSFFGLYGIG